MRFHAVSKIERRLEREKSRHRLKSPCLNPQLQTAFRILYTRMLCSLDPCSRHLKFLRPFLAFELTCVELIYGLGIYKYSEGPYLDHYYRLGVRSRAAGPFHHHYRHRPGNTGA